MEEEDNVKRDSEIISSKVKTVNLTFLDFAKYLIWCSTKIYLKEINSIFTQKKKGIPINKNLSKLF